MALFGLSQTAIVSEMVFSGNFILYGFSWPTNCSTNALGEVLWVGAPGWIERSCFYRELCHQFRHADSIRLLYRVKA